MTTEADKDITRHLASKNRYEESKTTDTITEEDFIIDWFNSGNRCYLKIGKELKLGGIDFVHPFDNKEKALEVKQQILDALKYYNSITTFNESLKQGFPRVDVGDIHLFGSVGYTIDHKERWNITGLGYANRNDVVKQLDTIRNALQELPKLKEEITKLIYARNLWQEECQKLKAELEKTDRQLADVIIEKEQLRQKNEELKKTAREIFQKDVDKINDLQQKATQGQRLIDLIQELIQVEGQHISKDGGTIDNVCKTMLKDLQQLLNQSDIVHCSDSNCCDGQEEIK